MSNQIWKRPIEICVTVVSVDAWLLGNLGEHTFITLLFCWVSLAWLASLFRWYCVLYESLFFSFYWTPDIQTGWQERGSLGFVELPYAPQMQYFSDSFASLLLCVVATVSQSIRHRQSKVTCQQQLQCVTLFSLLTSCYSFVSREGTSQLQSVTFPVSNAATAYHLGNCDKRTLMSQGLRWRLTIQEFFHSYRWHYIVIWLAEFFFFML